MQAWVDFIKKQEELLGKDAVEKWLLCLKVVHFDSGNLYLEAKDSFQVLWFEEHIRPILKSQLLNNNFRPVKVHLTVGDSTAPQPSSKFSKKEKGSVHPPVHFFQDKLDSSMTLENFIAGEANQVVFRLFCELAGYNPETEKQEEPKTPLGTFNPIYLWGASGSGKTHLLMALAQAFKKRGLNALYARAETFTEHVVAAIRGSEMQSFRKAYRNADILLIDDVHVFARKDATQEEFFHTFNTLHTTGRQIILSSKCAPALLEEIEPRLVSRFEWGINVHFEKLDSADLRRVLGKRCEAFNFPLSEEVAGFLIESFPSSKSLNKAFEALVLRCHLESDARHKRNSRLIDIESAQRMLSDLCSLEKKAALSPEKIISVVSSIYGIRTEDLLGKSQAQECSLPRQIAMYLCRQDLKMPFQGIGQIFGRDHSTVMTSIKQIEKKIQTPDRELLATLSEIKSKIQLDH
ncbi:MAG: ATP-binding protein [Verrucomicrobia bacterium]|nr:ATP-binding protein [Verrucomicrobiota bacterium]